jgi:hypothetical protein
MKKYILGLSAVVLAIGFSAFSTKNTSNAKFSTLFFQFSGTTEADSDLRNESLWSNPITEPTENPCTDGSQIVCVMHIESTTLDPLPGADYKAKLDYYFTNIQDPSDYVQNVNNISFQKDVE